MASEAKIERAAAAMVNAHEWSDFWSIEDARRLAATAIDAVLDPAALQEIERALAFAASYRMTPSDTAMIESALIKARALIA